MDAEPSTADIPTHLVRNVVRFGRLLRGLGLAVSAADSRVAIEALACVGVTRRDDVRAALQAVFVSRQEHLELFEQAFALFWSSRALAPRTRIDMGRMLSRTTRREEQIFVAAPEGPSPDSEGPEEGVTVLERRVTWSAREVLRHKDFAELDAEEERQVRQLMDEQVLRLAPRRTRRRVKATCGPYLDLRSTLRCSLAHGGEAVKLAWRRQQLRRRPLVVLCDISGSMEVYARLFLQFLYTLTTATDRLEVFAFGTRLTRITRQLESRNVHRALADTAAAIVDWGGGTRIGESLRTFNQDWARRVLGRGAVVLVISDGWDRGEAGLLEREVDRLHRRSHRLMWLNPLLGSPGYEPLTRGIRTILPRVDDFLPLYNLESLEQLAKQLESLG